LPAVISLYQKSKFGGPWDGIVGIFNCDLKYFGHLIIHTAIWYRFWSFGIFPHFGILHQEKSGNPDSGGPWFVVVISISQIEFFRLFSFCNRGKPLILVVAWQKSKDTFAIKRFIPAVLLEYRHICKCPFPRVF
jgi:hypothetical protein